MKILLLCAFAGLMPLAATATEAPTLSPLARWQADAAVVLDAREVDLADFQWLARAVIVFADTSADPRFQQQMALLAELPGELAQRDVVVIVDTDPAARSQPRQKLRPRGFMLALVAKDGTVSLRKPFPWDVRELSRAIDKMPLRQQEIRDRREQQ